MVTDIRAVAGRKHTVVVCGPVTWLGCLASTLIYIPLYSEAYPCL